MDFDIKKRQLGLKEKYPKNDLDIAYAFSKRAYKELGNLVRGIILFGAASRRQPHPGGDIDILIVLDDVSVVLNQNVVQTYKIIAQRIVNEVSRRIHVTTLRFTTVWEYAKNGDPLMVNILRDGVALVDTGWFDTLQLLLYQGRIKPTRESVWVYFARAPQTLANSKWHILQACLDLYWAVIDSAHSALMSRGVIPPSPDHVAMMLEKIFVKTKELDAKYPSVMRNFFKLSKMIVHREIKEVKGEEYDRYFREAAEFVNKMRSLITKKEERELKSELDKKAQHSLHSRTAHPHKHRPAHSSKQGSS